MIARAKSIEKKISHRRPKLLRQQLVDDSGPKSSSVDEIHYVHHPSFDLPETESILWGPGRQEMPVLQYSLPKEIADDEGSRRPKRNSLTAKQEETLFLRYNYAKYRLCRPHDCRQRDRWRRRAQDTRDQITHANLPLVPGMVRRYAPSGVEYGDMVSEGNMALLRSIEHFDVCRGFKFSTYACRAIICCFHRLGVKTQRYRKHVPVNFDPELQEADEVDRRHNQQLDSAIASVRDAVIRNRAELSVTEQVVLLARFPILTGSIRLTLAQLSEQVGVSKERVRQIEGACLVKLREVMSEYFAA